MKIRTVTTFCNLSYPANPEELEHFSGFNERVKSALGESGFDVQETRIATNFFEGARLNLDYEDVLAWVVNVQTVCSSLGVDFISLGTIKTGAKQSVYLLIPEMIAQTETVSLSVSLTQIDRAPSAPAVKGAARAIRLLSEQTESGTGNFRFGAIANCPGLVPFFPSAYHDGGPPRFAIGYESGECLYEVCRKAPNAEAAAVALSEEVEPKFKEVERICEDLAWSERIDFVGADLSLNPGLLENESICLSVEKLAGGELGCAGTLRVVAMLVDSLRRTEIKKCGYSGVFLPVLEDYGLAQRSNEGKLSLSLLLAISVVCGAGLDAVPLPGDTTEEKLEAVLFDLAAVSGRAGKPLSARLLLAPGKGTGEKTEFGLPFFIDCATIPV
jgi:uncharacterized protein (UPF0210 family)